jgi:predicted RNA binding protein YcfA (HicA-like mRNA interferase family)
VPRFFSGKEIGRILTKKYGFEKIRIAGSHLIMKNAIKKLGVVIPPHREVKPGTFFGILKTAGIDKEDFLKKSKE